MSVPALRLLGQFQLIDPLIDSQQSDDALVIFDHPRVHELIGYLALHAGEKVSRQSLAYLLWPDSSDAQARTNVRNLLFKLRRAWVNANDFVDVTRSQISWNRERTISVDVHQFEEALAHAASADDPAAEEHWLQQAADLYAGPLLPDLYSEWVLVAREELQQAHRRGLTRLVALLEGQRRYEEAIHTAQRLLRLDPLQESVYRQLMQIHAARGDRAAALHVYHECASMLEQELAVEPVEATRQLHAQLLKQEKVSQKQSPSLTKKQQRLIGRQLEWRQLETAWKQAGNGRPKLVLISGEAGIGKTRLAEELLDKAYHQGQSTASTRAYAVGGALAYAPVADWLRQPVLWDALQNLEPIWQVEVARLVPELLQHNPALPMPGPLQEGWQRQRFFQALIQVLRSAAPPLLLHIDDLQWCDDETLSFLHYLLSSEPDQQILIVSTVRSEEIAPSHPLNRLRWSLGHHDQIVEIELGPLSAAESGELARQTADDGLSTEAQARLFEESEGHPLFLIETILARNGGNVPTDAPLADRQTGTSFSDVTAIPPKIRNVIRGRLAQLSAKAQEITRLAAVIGREFTYEVLREASDESEETLVQAVDELWQRRLLREQGEAAYDFSHDRIREVAYAEQSPLRRRWLHRRVAEALERVHADHLSTVYGRLAGHFEEARLIDKACYYFGKAGEVACQQYANMEAIHYFSRALDLLPENAHLQRYELYKQREQIYDASGQRPEQKADLEALTAWVQGHMDLYPHAEAEIALRWSRYYHRIGEQESAVVWAQRSVALGQEIGDTAILAEGHFRWASAVWSMTNFEEARQQYMQAANFAKVAGLPAIESVSLEQIAATGMFSGMRVGDMRVLLEQAEVITERSGDKQTMASLQNKLGYLPYALGAAEQYDQALESYRKGLAISREIGDTHHQCTILSNLVMLHTLRGEYDAAHDAFEQNQHLTQATLFPFRQAIGNHFWGCALLQQGDWDGARQQIGSAIEQLQSLGISHFCVKASADLGLVHHLAGRQDEALAVLQDVRTVAENHRDRRGLAVIWTRLGYCHEATGHLDEAVNAYRKGQDFHCQMEQVSHSMNGLAGEARLAFGHGDLPTAQRLVSSILAYVEDHQLEETIESVRVYLTCTDILTNTADPRAETLLRTVHAQLQRRRRTIQSAHLQQTFWQIPEHQAVQAHIERLGRRANKDR